jgi:hypothetical protein
MWGIPFNGYSDNLLVWKYRGKIKGGVFKNRITAPPSFDVVVKQYNKDFKTVQEGSANDLRSVSDIYFVRKRTTDFSVQNSKEIVKSIAGVGSEIEISFFLELLKNEPKLERLIKMGG